MKDHLKEIERKIESELLASFGATAISVSMNDGNISDGIIQIRDNAIKKVLDLSSNRKTLELLKEEVEKEKLKAVHESYCDIVKCISDDCGCNYEAIIVHNTALDSVIKLIEETLKK